MPNILLLNFLLKIFSEQDLQNGDLFRYDTKTSYQSKKTFYGESIIPMQCFTSVPSIHLFEHQLRS